MAPTAAVRRGRSRAHLRGAAPAGRDLGVRLQPARGWAPAPGPRGARGRWKSGPEEERELWQGLAQLRVDQTHHERGNAVGASGLIERAAGQPETYETGGGPTYGLDLGALLGRARDRARSN
ncbi:MAG: DUF309 domain-containing protein [Nocardioides sp.]|uniref:DUF309 domain-containing protein n=1 Tax=Nocardioides sp. TaxID=35761 RepID=UPI003D6BD859